MGWLDRVQKATDNILGAIAPVRQARRTAAREALRLHDRMGTFAAERSYDGAKARRNWHNRSVEGGSADADLLDNETLHVLRERSRDRVRNDPIAAAAINSLVDNIVGHGFRPRLRLDRGVLGLNEETARTLEAQAAAIWEEWGRNCDSTNRLSIDDMQSLVVASTLTNGDIFAQPLMVTDARIPSRFELKVELIEADRVDSPIGMNDPKVRGGVELGRRGQPIAYWVHRQHPGDIHQSIVTRGKRTFRRIPAHARTGRPNILHVFHQERPGQSRGRPSLSTVLNTLKDRDDYREAELIAAQVSACFAAFITKTDPFGVALGRATSDTSGNDDREEELSPGAITYLRTGESVDFGNPTRPNTSFGDFLSAITREVTSALGMPYEVATRDFSGTTYSQARAALLEARRMFVRRQRWLVRAFLQPLWEMVLEEAWLKGFYEATDFAENVHAWTRTHWQPPGWGWIDPQKEVVAEKTALDMGVTTRQAIISARSGDDFEDITRQLSEEEQFRETLGVSDPEPEPPAGAPPGGDESSKGDESDEDTTSDPANEPKTEEATA